MTDLEKKQSVLAYLKPVYQRLYSTLPANVGEKLSDAVFWVTRRPFVYIDRDQHPTNGLKRGTVTFSIDFEMAWATRYSKWSEEDCVTRGLREREQFPQILGKFNEFDIPATWATVGHLFLENCVRGSNGLAHPDMPRCSHFENKYWRFMTGDWFQHDPCSDVRKDPAWYAPDLIEAIKSSVTRHEIGCHSFSHAGFGVNFPPEVAEAELDACIETMKQYDIYPTTLVFPGNDCGKYEIVFKKGIEAVRAFPISWAEISLPLMMKEGLWAIHSSTGVDSHIKIVSYQNRLNRLKIYVDRAIQKRMNAHFWFHPSLPKIQMERLLFPLLQYCATHRDKGMVDILTIKQLVSEAKQSK